MSSSKPIARLTPRHEELLCKAYEHAEHRVLGAPPKVREALVHFGYLIYAGRNKAGYDQYILTKDGLDRAALLSATRALNIHNKDNNDSDQVNIKAALFDEIVETVVNPLVGAKTIDLMNGRRVKFDRIGPSKLVMKVVKQ